MIDHPDPNSGIIQYMVKFQFIYLIRTIVDPELIKARRRSIS